MSSVERELDINAQHWQGLAEQDALRVAEVKLHT